MFLHHFWVKFSCKPFKRFSIYCNFTAFLDVFPIVILKSSVLGAFLSYIGSYKHTFVILLNCWLTPLGDGFFLWYDHVSVSTIHPDAIFLPFVLVIVPLIFRFLSQGLSPHVTIDLLCPWEELYCQKSHFYLFYLYPSQCKCVLEHK